MMVELWENFDQLLARGGYPVMIALLALSIIGLAMIVTQLVFWIATHRPRRTDVLKRIIQLLHRDDLRGARDLASQEPGVYGQVARQLLGEPDRSDHEAVAVEIVEAQRPRIERFMTSLTTIITVAPMLGILGTVLGLMHSLGIWSDQAASNDPRSVASGIAEALITTATGLVIAIVVLFPYNYFRGQIERCLSRLESLSAAAVSALTRHNSEPDKKSQSQTPA